MANYELVKLWETVVCANERGASAETVGFYSTEELAKEAGDPNDKEVIYESFPVNAVKIGDEYLIGTVRPARIDLPKRKRVSGGV